MSELVENLREACIDFSGEAIADHSEPRRIVDCGELRKAADMIERQAGLIQAAMNALYVAKPYVQDAAEGHLVLLVGEKWIDEQLLIADLATVQAALAKLEAQ